MRNTLIFVITMMLAFSVALQNAQGATKSRTAVSPYIQTDADSTYTFVGISHPSLNTAGTQIGLTIATVGMDGANPSSTFTVGAGETYRVFIVSTNHSSVNSTTVTGDRVVFLSTTTGGTGAGQLRVTAVTYAPISQGTGSTSGPALKTQNLNQLSMWGAIVIPSSSTGFAMEFVGDAHDSNELLITNDNSSSIGVSDKLTAGRGVN
tara:strand:+ start:563 stop:1183 length:621 start_codon:yes stop_codon:yes gene_type:complete